MKTKNVSRTRTILRALLSASVLTMLWQPVSAQQRFQHIDCSGDYNPDPCGNLVLNGDFTRHYGPWGDNSDDNLGWACPWNTLFGSDNLYHSGSPDFYHPILGNPMKAPSNLRGIENDHSGTAGGGYAGFYTYAPFVSANSQWREYMSHQFPLYLQAGQTYEIKFSLSLAEMSTYATPVEVLLTPSLPATALTNGPLSASPIYTTTPVTTYNGWEDFVTTFTPATTGNYYLAFGNFHDNANTPLTPVSIPPVPGVGQPTSCYYYIDDIRVVKITSEFCCGFDLIIEGDLNDGTSVPSLNSYNIQPNDKVLIRNMVNIDQSVSYNNVQFFFRDPNSLSGMFLSNNVNVSFNNCVLQACDTMWNGIWVNGTNQSISFINTTVKDATRAVYIKNGNTISSTNSRFENNYIGVEMENYSGTWPASFQKTIFTAPSLKIPMLASKGLVGIRMTNSGTVNVIASDVANKNQFTNIQNGILATNTNLNVSSSYFLNVKDYTAVTNDSSYCIYSRNTNPATLKKVVVTNSTGLNAFVNSRNGIFVDGTFTVDVRSNTFSNLEYVGVHNRNNNPWAGHPLPQVLIYQNQFTNVNKLGVDLANLKHTTVQIGLNNFNNSTYKPFSRAINIKNMSYTNSSCSVISNTIHGNIISRFYIGVYTSLVQCAEIYANTIQLNAPWNDQYHGIWNVNGKSVNTFDNTVTGTYSGWQCIGIRNEYTPNSSIFCNTVSNTGEAIWIHGNSNPTMVKENTMSIYQHGISLAANCIIGPQVVFFNDVSARNRWDKLSNVEAEIYTDNVTNGANSKYYLLAGDPVYASNSLNLQSLGTLPVPLVISKNNVLFCETPQPIALPLNLMASKNTLTEFYQQSQLWIQDLDFYRSRNNDQKKSDEILNRTRTLSGSNVAIFSGVEDLLTQNQFDAALRLNKTISPSLKIEEAYFNINEILIPALKNIYTGENWKLTESQLKELLKIAFSCPHELGEAVTISRNFIHTYINSEIIFEDNCMEMESPKKTGESNFEISLFPNPSQSYVQITIDGAEEGTIFDLQLMDVQGRLIENFKVVSNQMLNTEHLQNGVYLYVIRNGEKQQQGKLIIQH